MTPNIPGFYYDEAKKKYFRIQQSHTLPAGSNIHTHRSVKAAERTKILENDHRRRTRKHHATHIRRSPLVSTLGFQLLELRVGKRASVNKCIVEDVVRKLSWRVAIDTGPIINKYDNPITIEEHRVWRRRSRSTLAGPTWPVATADSKLTQIAVQSFVITPEKRMIAILRDEQEPQFARYKIWHGIPQESTSTLHAYSIKEDERDIRSIVECNLSSGLIACDASGSQTILQYRQTSPSTQRVFQRCPILQPWQGRFMGPMVRDTYIRDIATSPTTQDVAIATDHRILAFNMETFHLDATRTGSLSTDLVSHSRPQMNIAFKDANIIMSGETTGKVNFCDRRIKDETVVRLYHSSAVLGIKPMSVAEQIIVHGFTSTSIYDLRYSKGVAPKSSKASSEFKSSSSYPPWRRKHERTRTLKQKSIPYIDFAIPEHCTSDHYTYGKKLAYSPNLNLVVAASSSTTNANMNPNPNPNRNPSINMNPNRNPNTYRYSNSNSNQTSDSNPNHSRSQNKITIYSTRTGKMINSPLNDFVFPGGAFTLDMKSVRSTGVDSIFTLCDGELKEWTFHDTDLDLDLYLG